MPKKEQLELVASLVEKLADKETGADATDNAETRLLALIEALTLGMRAPRTRRNLVSRSNGPRPIIDNLGPAAGPDSGSGAPTIG